MAGELVVADRQIQLRDWLGGPGGSGDWIDQVGTWWGGMTVRNRDVPRMSADGIRGGIDLLGAKSLQGSMLLVGADEDDLRSQIDQMAVAWAPSSEDVPVVVMLLGEKRRRYGRPRRFDVDPKLATYFAGQGIYAAKVSFEFLALDPYVYADDEQSLTIGLPGTGGFVVPFTPPFTLAAGTSGIGAVVNGGTVPAPWTARLDGPLTSPTITCGEFSLQFDVNGGLVIGAGEHVVVDSSDRSVLINGSGDRRATLNAGSTWFALAPGTNSVGLAADTGSGTMTIFWRDTYI